MNNVRRFAIGLGIACSAAIVAAESLPTVTFEQFSQGSPNGQFGWKSTGSDGQSCAGQPYDHQIAPNTTRFASFGRQSLRISNAVTSQCLQDQTFSAPNVQEAGEPTAYDTRPTGGRQPYYLFEIDFASAFGRTYQEGLVVVVSADNGEGARMSWVEIADLPNGLEVTFAEYIDNPPYGTLANPADGRGPEDGFFFTTVASGLNRNARHRLRVEHSFYGGPRNDVVTVRVDSDFVVQGTSWEDYYRWQQGPGDPQQTAPVRESRVVRSILFQTRNESAPNTLGFGFLFDNVKQTSGPIPPGPPAPSPEPGGPPSDKDECKNGGWRSFNNPAFRNQGQCVAYVKRHDPKDDHDRGHGRGDRDDPDGDDDHGGRGDDGDDGHGRGHDHGRDRDDHDRHHDRDNDSGRHESQRHRDRDDGRGGHHRAS